MTLSGSRRAPRSSFGTLNIENVQDRTLRRSGARTSGNRFRQEALKLREIGHFRPDILEVVSSNLFDFSACGSFRRSETEQGADFVKGKSEFPSASHESEHAQVRFPINAPAAGRAWRRWQHLDPFVVADRLDVHPAACREFPNWQIVGSRNCDGAHRKVLDPVVATGCTVHPCLSTKKVTSPVRSVAKN